MKIPSFPSELARFPNKKPENFEQQMERVMKTEQNKKIRVINQESGNAKKPAKGLKDAAAMKRKIMQDKKKVEK